MRGINATSRLAAASRLLGGNCFHTTFTGESGTKEQEAAARIYEVGLPFPPLDLRLPPPIGGAEGCCGRAMQVICYPSLA